MGYKQSSSRPSNSALQTRISSRPHSVSSVTFSLEEDQPALCSATSTLVNRRSILPMALPVLESLNTSQTESIPSSWSNLAADSVGTSFESSLCSSAPVNLGEGNQTQTFQRRSGISEQFSSPVSINSDKATSSQGTSLNPNLHGKSPISSVPPLTESSKNPCPLSASIYHALLFAQNILISNIF